ncbi:hypothetical protein [uncultured Roseobacter sp.]|uniref:hypothetical protein n=1 Tax=uncultured Roseobacter sp. TaxID=114847 RepID=UPI0026120251|nr:hypothetical protein [uncultured Roseobacter sp.]
MLGKKACLDGRGVFARVGLLLQVGRPAALMTKALGFYHWDICVEFAPCILWITGESGGHPIALASKSGNLGAEDFFAHVFNVLEAP